MQPQHAVSLVRVIFDADLLAYEAALSEGWPADAPPRHRAERRPIPEPRVAYLLRPVAAPVRVAA